MRIKSPKSYVHLHIKARKPEKFQENRIGLLGVEDTIFLNENSKSKMAVTLSKMIESKIKNHIYIFIPEKKPAKFQENRTRRLRGVGDTRFSCGNSKSKPAVMPLK